MASNSSPRHSRSFSMQQPFLICILLVSIPLLFLVFSLTHERSVPHVTRRVQAEKTKSSWFEVITKGIKRTNNIKVGLVNIDKRVDGNLYEQLDTLHPQVETVSIHFDNVNGSLKWEDFFPEFIDEDKKWGQPKKCPEMPMPMLKDYEDLHVVMARVPCGKEGIRDVFRLQVNLVVANLAAESGWVTKLDSNPRKVYVVFVGSCGPMVELFRCDDLLMHQGEYWVYEPDLKSLKQQTLMPVGSCQIAPAYSKTGKELWRPADRKFAYVTILHSSEAYVCGAIALAQSIPQIIDFRHPTPELLLLVDDSIGPKSIRALKAAGWKIKHIQSISNPFAKKGAYNNIEWSYNKLRIWQLTMYDKIIFLDPDLLVLKSMDDFFAYPQLSTTTNNENRVFNSGLMVIEPSQCMFENMMQKMLKVQSNNGDDQGNFLNEIFTWWHRLPLWKLNYYIKSFESKGGNNEKHEVPEDVYAIQFLGLKPWMCYRDYDCNWDMEDHHIFASDLAHQKWWQVYDAMPKELQSYCGLTKKMDERIMHWRAKARNANLSDGHWKINVTDPRRKNLVG